MVCQGAITTGYASDVTDDQVQANVEQVYRSAALEPLKSDDAAVVWSNAVLIEAASAKFPKGPGAPQDFHGFDHKHFFGNGPSSVTTLMSRPWPP